jgi:hypothetical protein
MFKDPARLYRSPLVFCCCLSVALTALCAQTLSAQEEGGYVRKVPFVGCRVIKVTPGGQAERGGVQVMDLLSKYGEYTVVDHSTYYKAREAYLKNPSVKIPVEFWRGHEKIVINVFPGRLGVDTNEYNPVAYQFDSAMMHVDTTKNLPEYMRDVEFKEAFENDGAAKSIEQAREIIDRAEAEGTLTAMQILVARINLILDNAPEEELKKQDVLLAEFMRTQPLEYIGYLGDKLMRKEHFRPARVLLKQYQLSNSDDVSIRLNLGYIGLNLGYWEDAEAAADLVLSDPQKLSKNGLRIAYQQKASGALHRGDYDTAMTYAEKGFALTGETFELLMIQLVAALTGNVEKFNDASRRFKEAQPEMFEKYSLQRESAEALVLALNGQDEQARAIVARWSQKDRVPGRLKYYWLHFPASDKVIDNWLRLAAPQK